ncbi:MAG: hypothetical protein DI527_02100 [Chelatococcus sp.]|nr:MAG: hypothetical protein DI527_02100 [Chelatococcus sp.]
MTIHTKPNTDNAQFVPVLTIKSGRVMANSRDVARAFDKEHKAVLRAIREMDCSDEFRGCNFAPFKTNDLSGESTSHVDMTRDGFVFLVMGFIGPKAARFKESYIAEFNRMEAELRLLTEQEAEPAPPVAYFDDGLRLHGYSRWQMEVIIELLKLASKDGGPQTMWCAWDAHNLPSARRGLIRKVVDTAVDDPRGCLNHLFRYEARCGGTVGSLLDLALRDEASRSALRSHGIIVDPGGRSGYVAFADTHPFLRQAFSETQWAGEWKKALIFLDGAMRTKKTLPFNGAASLAVLVPRATVMNLRDRGSL